MNGVNIHHLDPVADIAALASGDVDFDNITARHAEELMIEQNRHFVYSERSNDAFRKMFDLMLEPNSHAIVQHCRGGKDRTGFGIALILLLLGVSKDLVIFDYMLTNHYKKDKNEKSLTKLLDQTQNEDFVQAVRFFKEANRHFLETALDRIEEDFGGIEPYVKKQLGLTDCHIEAIRKSYIEL